MKYETVTVNKASELVDLFETYGSVIYKDNECFGLTVSSGNKRREIYMSGHLFDTHDFEFPIEVQIPKKPDWHDAICVNKPVACRVWDDPLNDRYRVFVCEYDSAREVYIDDSGSEWYYAEPLKDDEITIWQEEPVDDGWIEWNGGECPVDPDTKVRLIFRDGNVVNGFAGSYNWNHRDWGGDIIHYEAIKD